MQGNGKVGRLLGRGGIHALLIVASLSLVMPFLWMVSTSLRSTMEIT